MRCQNPLCELSPPHKPPCVTQDGPMWFEENCADVGELRAELEELRASSRLRPSDEHVKAEIAIVENQLQAARTAPEEK